MAPLLSVLYVVRNEEKFLEKSIRSVLEIADEIVIVDTGSCDRTLQICRRFHKTKIYTHGWVHDFAKTKNHGIKHCQGKWILSIDADEMLDDASASRIRQAISKAPSNVAGFSLRIVDHEQEWGPLSPKNEDSFFGSPQVRVFRNSDKIRFEGKVQESVEPSLKKEKLGADLLDASIHHNLWRGRGEDYKYLKLSYYNKLGARFDLPSPRNVSDPLPPDSQLPKVAVVMLAHNGLALTKECLEALYGNTRHPFDLYFVDNGSSDDTLSFVRQATGREPISMGRNLGVAKGRNAGATEALRDPSVKYVCFLDNDTAPTQDWLQNMVALMEENQDVGILAPLAPSATGAQNASSQGLKGVPSMAKEAAKREPALVDVEEVDRFCMLVRPSVLGKIGLFDDSLGIYGYEEADFCRRARGENVRIAVANRVLVGHKGGATLHANRMNWRRIMAAASHRYMVKWGQDEWEEVGKVPKSAFSAENLLAKKADANTTPRTSIIVIGHNRLDMTKLCVNTVIKYTTNFELIFVDNGSTDGTADWVERHECATVIRNDRNLGVAKARNQGLRASRCEFVVMMDNDVEAQIGWLEELFEKMREGFDIVGIEAWKLGPDHCPTHQCSAENHDFDYLGGACCLFKRKVFEEAGILDEGFSPAYFEDVDLCIRAKKQGFRLGYRPTPQVIHREHSTLINGQKEFKYQDQLAKSHARFRDKMNGNLTIKEERLPPLDRQLKILYLGMFHDYGEPSRGLSFEHTNFFPSLRQWERTKELVHFDFVELARSHGVPKMSSMLMDAVQKFQPDAMFSVFFNPEHDPRMEVVRKITEQTPTVTINWFCDSHWRYDDFDRRWAECLSYCVTTSSSAYERYRNDGFKDKAIKSQWAASPKYRRIPGVKKDIDVSFVGQPHGNRRAMIQALQHAEIPVQVYGNGWGNRLSFDEMVMVFNRSKISLNLANASGMQGKQIKGRNFEVPACGGFLLTEKADNLGDYYKPGKEVETFGSVDEMIRQIRYYLKHEGLREQIANAGYERTMAEHTFFHRYDHIFSRAGVLG